MTQPLQNKRIVLGVTGSIAAYKAAELASRLTQAGALVDVILTESAQKFIQPITFQSVTGRKAYIESDLWGGEGHVTHIALGHQADLLVIAPASANTMAKLAHGMGDNLLSVTALAANCPLLLAPAMDAGMYSHPATQSNVLELKSRGAFFVGPMPGHLASGLVGVGRMAEPAEIFGNIRWLLAQNGPLAEKQIVVTAGGTQEAIDPVRFITNRSSGRQGYAVAQAALDAGAHVTLITAPTNLNPPIGVNVVPVKTASEMLKAVLQQSAHADALVMCAAVADFRPTQAEAQKIKKGGDSLQLNLSATEDILKNVAEARAQTGFPRCVVGFAAESQDLIENARAKLQKKQLDMIVANDISAADAGFEVSTNRVTFLFSDGLQENLPVMQKSEVAEKIMEKVAEWITAS